MSVTEIRENEEQLRICALAAKALSPVLPTIFKYLNTRELLGCSAVCKTWKEEAEREFARRTIEVLPIAIVEENPYHTLCLTFEEVNLFRYSINPNHLANFIGILPAQSYIFYDDSSYSNVVRTLLCHYMFQLRNRVGYIGVKGMSINTEEIHGSKNRALGVFIPDINKFHVYGSTCYWYNIHQWVKMHDDYVQRQVTYLMETPDEGAGHCIILFILCDYRDKVDKLHEFKNAWLKNFNARPRTESIAVWGAQVNNITLHRPGAHKNESTPWLQRNIRGISVHSFSVSVDLSLSPFQRARILEKFKQAISLRRLTNAFAIVPVCKNESFATRLAKTTDFRTLFPKIKLTTIYNDEEFPLFTANTVDEGPARELYNHIAYLIISRQ